VKLTLLGFENGTYNVHNEGPISLKDWPQGEDPLVKLLGPNCYGRKVHLNLNKTPYIDSLGVGWLIMTHKRFEEAGGTLRLHSITPMVDHILKLLRLQELLHMGETRP
jgi:anti-anti-sigma factor